MDRRQMINGILSSIKGAPAKGSVPISWWLKHPEKISEKLGLVVIQKGNDFFIDNEKVDMEIVREVAETVIILPDNGR